MFDKAERKLKELVGTAQEKVEETAKSAERQTENIAMNHISQGGGGINNVTEIVKDNINHNPIRAVVIAGFAGVFLGLLLGRK